MQPEPRYRIYSKPADYASVARELVTRRWLRGSDCRDLESDLERLLPTPHALCIAKARVGIYLAVRAIVQPGQKVVLSPYTISDVINMVVCAGGVPVFADLERETCNVDPDDVERLIDADTGAVMVTHLHGLACDMKRVTEICRAKGVPLIEDAAQAFGARSGGQRVGTFGDAGIFSFGMYKNVNAFFGGMIVTPRDDLVERLRPEIEGFPPQEAPYYLSKVASALATDVATWPPLFKSLTYPVFRFGYLKEIGLLNNQVTVDVDPQLKRELPESYLRRLTPMQARIVRRQLDTVDDKIHARIERAQRYAEGLRDIKDILLPPLRSDLSHTYSYFPIQVEKRDAFLRHVMQERRDMAPQHLHNCADLDCFEKFRRECPRARAIAASVVLLPTYPRYSLADVDRNIAVIRSYFGRS